VAVRPKLSNTTLSITSRRGRRKDHRQTELKLEPEELYREACEDEGGRRYIVIVWRPIPGLSLTEYTLEDGSPVKFVDDCLFQVVDTGAFITRCA
jgi:hypothetical protein